MLALLWSQKCYPVHYLNKEYVMNCSGCVIGLLLLSGCLFDTESVGDLENGIYTSETDETWITQKITTKTSIRISYRHYEKIEIIESLMGDYPRLNDELNWMNKSIFKNHGRYKVLNDTAYFYPDKAGTLAVWSIDTNRFGNIQGDPLRFGPEDVSYTHSFPNPRKEPIEVSDSGFTIKNYDFNGHRFFRKNNL